MVVTKDKRRWRCGGEKRENSVLVWLECGGVNNSHNEKERRR